MDTKRRNQLNAVQEQHKDLCNFFQGASTILHTILLAMDNIHPLEPFKELDIGPQKVRKLASKILVHSVNYAAKLVHTYRRDLYSAITSFSI